MGPLRRLLAPPSAKFYPPGLNL